MSHNEPLSKHTQNIALMHMWRFFTWCEALFLNLANIEYERKELFSANEYLNKLKNYELKPLVKSEMDKLTEKINVAQQDV